MTMSNMKRGVARMVVVLVMSCCLALDEAKVFKLKQVQVEHMHPQVLQRVLDEPHRSNEKKRFQAHGRVMVDNAKTYYNVTAAAGVPMIEHNTKFDLFGSILSTGYYAIDVEMGTPPQKFHVIVDTGSTVGYVSCSFCGDHCGKHINPPFNPQLSTTATYVPCLSRTCGSFCGKQRCGCQPSISLNALLPVMNVCTYSKRYQEFSSSRGIIMRDTFVLDDAKRYFFNFGCETRETGEIFKQKADGVIGLGDSTSSLINQLLMNGAIDHSFSFCIGGLNGGGALLLGSPSIPPTRGPMQYLKLIKNPLHPVFYSVNLMNVKMGANIVNVPPAVWSRGYGAVLDTGTTFIYLPTEAFLAFHQQLKLNLERHANIIRIVKGPDPRYPDDVCYALKTETLIQEELMQMSIESITHEFLKLFPPLTLQFESAEGGTVLVDFPPSNYVFRTPNAGVLALCVGVYDNGNSGTLIGGVLMRDFLVNFDVANGRVGFAQHNCAEL